MKRINSYKKYNFSSIKIIFVLSLLILTMFLLVKLWPHEIRKSNFIDKIAPEALELKKQTGILPSIIIGQAILESNFGKSELAIKANNLFGIKGDYKGNSVKMPTIEYANKTRYTIEAEFRAYPDWKSSLIDHTKLFLEGNSWNENQYDEVVDATNYKKAAYALKKNSYSTDPKYPEKLIDIIEQYKLDKYDH